MKELGQKLGIAHGSIKFWEMHKGPPSRENRALLVGYLFVSQHIEFQKSFVGVFLFVEQGRRSNPRRGPSS